MKITRTLLLATLAACLFTTTLPAQVPQIIGYQGRVAVGGVNFSGSGQFKFALVNAAGTTTYWSNDGTSAAGSEPTAAVSLTVAGGLYSVLLGDATLPGMVAIPATVFANADVRLRIWFNDGTNGFQLLTPDQRIAAVGYAMIAGTVQDGAITSAKIATGAVGSAQLAANAVQSADIAPGTIIPAVPVNSISQVAVANTLYHANSSSLTDFILPTTANLGDTIQIVGNGTGGWSTMTGDWVARESNRTWAGVASSADGTKLVAVVNGGQIYTSTDSGVSWTPRESDRIWRGVASSTDGTKLVAVANGQIYTSTDSGVSWTPRESNRIWISVASSADGTKLVAVVVSGQIYTSTDSGVSWTPRESTRDWRSVASSADGTKLAAVASSGQIYTSTDSGMSWTPRDSNREWRSVASSADGTKLVAAVVSGQIYTSTDSGVSWTPRETNNNREWRSVASSADGTKLVAVVVDGRIYTSTDSGVSWTPREGNRFWLSVASSADGTKLAAVVNGGQIYTNPTGQQGTTATLQYLGAGEWSVLESAGSAASLSGSITAQNIPAGIITGSMIADGVIVNADISTAAAIDATKLGTGVVTTTEFNRLNGVTSDIQPQLNAKLSLSGGTLTGGLTAPGFNLSTPATRVLQISANGFVPDRPSEGYDRGAGLISPDGDTFLQFLANVHLPDGATVTKLVAVFSDLGAENFTDIDVRMRYFSTTNFNAVIMAEVLDQNTVGLSGGRVEFEDSTISGAVIDNTNRVYTVDANFTVDSATSNTRFYGVRIEYTISSLAP